MKYPNTPPPPLPAVVNHCSVSYFHSVVRIVVPLGLNLFYSCHHADVVFTSSYSSHTTLWLILPIKLHSCTSLCTRIHPSELSNLQLMLFSLSPMKYSVIIRVPGGVSVARVGKWRVGYWDNLSGPSPVLVGRYHKVEGEKCVAICNSRRTALIIMIIRCSALDVKKITKC
jgi:hypothetical protein